ncbi:MAG: hypothetical protein PWQ41_1081 [Bacillota bacterium]|nr:hypothetical protein [Bacillota bacterium]
MGRPSFFRQRIITQAGSLEAKGLFNYLVSEIKARREVPLEEAILIAHDAQAYLERNLLRRGPGQIEFPARAASMGHRKVAREKAETRLIRLSVIAEEDIELMSEFGITVMEKGRLARLIEEAYFQGALLDGKSLGVLLCATHRRLTNHLKGFWAEGAFLPLAGMKREHRLSLKNLRAVLALERYLAGEDLRTVRRTFALSSSRWQSIWHLACTLAARKDLPADKIAPLLGESPELISRCQELIARQPDVQLLTAAEGGWLRRLEDLPSSPAASFAALLEARHGYSPAAAANFIADLNEIAERLGGSAREAGQIIYTAVADTEPPGRTLSECQLKAVHLSFLLPEDWEVYQRDSAAPLRWNRLLRFSTEARKQGATLSQPDLALLLGCSVEAIRHLLKEHPNVVLPTRGFIADLGPALSHAEKIIRLYMDGYTETEIARRTGHSYDSIEKYLLDFARVVYLAEQGMPLPAIRQVLAVSRRLVEKHLSLYREFAGPDYAFRLARIRRLAEAHPVKKTPNQRSETLGTQEGGSEPLRHPSCQGCTKLPNCPPQAPL